MCVYTERIIRRVKYVGIVTVWENNSIFQINTASGKSRDTSQER